MKSKVVILILVSLFFLLNCWSPQDNEITKPVIPFYTFNGQVVDMDTYEILPGTQVKLVENEMLYEVEFGTQIVTADSTGMFQFDSVYPGKYLLSVERDGFFINETKFQVEHADTSTALEVPQLYFVQEFLHSYSKSPAFSCSGSTALVNIYWRAGNTAPFINSDMFAEYKYENRSWFNESKFVSPYNPRLLSSMTYIRDGLIICMNTDTLYQMNRWDGTKAGQFHIDHIARGVAFHIINQCIYTCSGGKLYKHNSDDFTITDAVYSPGQNNYIALAYYKNLYAFDNDKAILEKFDSDTNITNHYAMMTDSGVQITDLFDMSFDGYGNLLFTR